MDGKWCEHVLCKQLAALGFLSQQGATARSLKIIFSYAQSSVFLSRKHIIDAVCPSVRLNRRRRAPADGAGGWRRRPSLPVEPGGVNFPQRERGRMSCHQQNRGSRGRAAGTAAFQGERRAARGPLTRTNTATTSCYSCPRAQTSLVNYCQSRRELAADPEPLEQHRQAP